MDLNHHQEFYRIDLENMLDHIDGLPGQLHKAWEIGQASPLPNWRGIDRILVAGMGGSAIGADLLAAYLEPTCQAPIFVQRDYTLPAWATGENTLVIASSHSGNTEETLAAFAAARQRGCRLLAVATGGELARQATATGATLWTFEHQGQPRAAVGFSFGLLLSLVARLNLIPDPSAELQDAIQAMRDQQVALRAHVPIAHNPAKRYAGQMVNRWVVVLGSGVLAPVARRWKGQVNELAKAWAQYEILPEADHNTLAGSLYPQEMLAHTYILFLRSPSDHPRNQLRSDFTKKALMLEGLGTDFIDAQGQTRLAHLWTALHLGDYAAYYLAMIYEVDPTPIAALLNLKQEMKNAAS